ITGWLATIVEKAHEIHQESERFGIDAKQLQTIGNAAKEMGIPLELVARAMNLVEINSYKAVTGEKAQSGALRELGIDAKAFYALSADQKMLTLADAYVKAADRGTAYANIAVIVGKRNT